VVTCVSLWTVLSLVHSVLLERGGLCAMHLHFPWSFEVNAPRQTNLSGPSISHIALLGAADISEAKLFCGREHTIHVLFTQILHTFL
jgi:hypothetical protein